MKIINKCILKIFFWKGRWKERRGNSKIFPPKSFLPNLGGLIKIENFHIIIFIRTKLTLIYLCLLIPQLSEPIIDLFISGNSHSSICFEFLRIIFFCKNFLVLSVFLNYSVNNILYHVLPKLYSNRCPSISFKNQFLNMNINLLYSRTVVLLSMIIIFIFWFFNHLDL